MDYLKQLWEHNRSVRILTWVVVGALVLMIISPSSRPPAQPEQAESAPSLWDRARSKLPGQGGLSGRVKRTTEKAIDAAGTAVEKTGDLMEQAVDRIGQ